MATFTIELKKALALQKDPGTGVNIGLDSYPIFAENHRVLLNRKIIEHYWNREIGIETISMFTFALRRKMNEIMPFYNQLYETELLAFDPISNYKLKTIRDDKTDENGLNHSENDTHADSASGSRNVSSNLPQTMLARDKNYASSGADAKLTGETNQTAKNDGTDENHALSHGESETSGYQGNPSDLLNAFRNTILNIDLSIILDLEELFLGVWDNGQEMLPAYGFGSHRRIGIR